MDIIVWDQLDEAERRAALARPKARSDAVLTETVRTIFEDVRARGWTALAEHAVRLDGWEPKQIAVGPCAAEARLRLLPEQIEALELAAHNITAFHEAARPQDIAVETYPGLTVHKHWRPIEHVGLYIPGGNRPLFSTLLMLAIPARIAGVEEIVVTTPPAHDGSIEPVLALAAELCGIEAVWTAGGAQAIAALAFGAGGILPVDKICGPGNAYVNEAKRHAAQLPAGPAIDLSAGPSELMVIADEAADPSLVAADLLSQAEHDACAQVMLVTTATEFPRQVELRLAEQLPGLPRAEMAIAALKSARVILASSLDEAAKIANAYAPEHLSLAVRDLVPLIDQIRNAGAIFAGAQAAETFGDYLAGSSHVLPTDGAARACGGVAIETFMRATTIHEVSDAAAYALSGPAAALARLEGLEGHARAAELRGSHLLEAAQ